MSSLELKELGMKLEPISSFLVQTGGFLGFIASYQLLARWLLTLPKPNCWPRGAYAH